MKTITELQRFYESDLLPILKILETERKKVVGKITAAAFVIVPAAALLMFFVRGEDAPVLILSLGGAALFGIYYFVSRGYVVSFKAGIIEKIVEFIDPALSYRKESYVSQGEFARCEIFQQRVDVYRGDDHVTGVIGKTKVEFSEIHAQYVTRGSKGRKSYHTIFKGLFFVGDFNKDFKGRTMVLPDSAERMFGASLGKMFQSWNKGRGDLVKLESPEFEKLFVVYGEDQIEARYILSASLMERIVNFRKRSQKTIYLSFVGSRIYVAISYAKNLFEPRVFQTLLEFSPIQEYFEDLELAYGLVEDLNLNTRIWSKE